MDYGLNLGTDPMVTTPYRVLYTYNDFGGVSEGSRILRFDNGSDSQFVVVPTLLSNIISARIDMTYSGMLPDGTIWNCSDDVNRIIKIYPEAIFENPNEE